MDKDLSDLRRSKREKNSKSDCKSSLEKIKRIRSREASRLEEFEKEYQSDEDVLVNHSENDSNGNIDDFIVGNNNLEENDVELDCYGSDGSEPELNKIKRKIEKNEKNKKYEKNEKNKKRKSRTAFEFPTRNTLLKRKPSSNESQNDSLPPLDQSILDQIDGETFCPDEDFLEQHQSDLLGTTEIPTLGTLQTLGDSSFRETKKKTKLDIDQGKSNAEKNKTLEKSDKGSMENSIVTSNELIQDIDVETTDKTQKSNIDIDSRTHDIYTTTNNSEKVSNLNNTCFENTKNDLDENTEEEKEEPEATLDHDPTTLSMKMNENSKNSVLVYWFDAFEDAVNYPGSVFLFGKLQNNKSVCIKVRNVDRNVFFRLGKKPDSAAIKELEAELKRLGVKSPRFKKTKKKVCFDEHNNSVPPYEREFVKCSYPFSEKEIPFDYKSELVKKTYGTNSSSLELLILKRRLKGPRWIVVSDIQTQKFSLSWCKLEFEVDSPKQIKVFSAKLVDEAVNEFSFLNQGESLGDRGDKEQRKQQIDRFVKSCPRLSVLSIAMSTVNSSAERPTSESKTENSIAMLSCVFYKSANVETSVSTKGFRSFDSSPEFQKNSFSCVRPLKSKKFPSDIAVKSRAQKVSVRLCSSEREMINFFLAKLQYFDPDVLVGHSLHKRIIPLLLQRMKALKVNGWSRINRLRISKIPTSNVITSLCGRLFCDTWGSASEFSSEKTFSLQHFASKYLDSSVVEFSPTDLPSRYSNSEELLKTVGQLTNTAFVTLKLMVFLSALPLTRQLSFLCGSLWSRSLMSKRADRNEFLMLHEFCARGFLFPDKNRSSVRSSEAKKGKASYEGGLVLEPVKGLYDKLVILLDFASLYPSIIKEYNICFTTISNWKYENAEYIEKKTENSIEPILPNIIDRLLKRRKNIKTLFSKEKNEKMKNSLDIRQKALKLVANSIYGCLGYERFRFSCKSMATLITYLGRENLSLVKSKTESFSFEPPVQVIYGDTDSIMISTNTSDYAQAKKVASEVVKTINKSYRSMELQLEGIFRNMLLLQKKKYAARLIVADKGEGEFETRLETKGIDLVRRDWCPLSKDLGNKILCEILSTTKSRDAIIESIQSILVETREQIDAQKVPVGRFVITKSLTKNPNSYNDAKIHPHVLVALSMLKQGMIVSEGDHISYIITRDQIKEDISRSDVKSNTEKTPHSSNDEGAELQENETRRSNNKSAAERAVLASRFIKDDLKARAENKKPARCVDTEWYLVHQIFPPISRLCEPIPELPSSAIAHFLGVSRAKGVRSVVGASEHKSLPFVFCAEDQPGSLLGRNEAAGFQLFKKDLWRFRDLPEQERFPLSCRFGCDNGTWEDIFDVNGAFALCCRNKSCTSTSLMESGKDVARFQRTLTRLVEEGLTQLKHGRATCDGLMCAFSTSEPSSENCPKCSGTLRRSFTKEKMLTRLLYYKSIFSLEDAIGRAQQRCGEKDYPASVPATARKGLEVLEKLAKNRLCSFEYYFVDLKALFEPFVFKE